MKFISHSSGAWKSKIRLLAFSISGECPHQRALQPANILLVAAWLQPANILLYPYMAKAERGSKVSQDSYKGTNPTHEGSTLMTSSNSNPFPKASPSDTTTLRGRVSTHQFGTDTVNPLHPHMELSRINYESFCITYNTLPCPCLPVSTIAAIFPFPTILQNTRHLLSPNMSHFIESAFTFTNSSL